MIEESGTGGISQCESVGKGLKDDNDFDDLCSGWWSPIPSSYNLIVVIEMPIGARKDELSFNQTYKENIKIAS